MQVTNFIKHLVKESALYTLGPTLQAGVAFFLIPIYTRHLLPNEYGILEFILAIGLFINPIIDSGLTSSFWKYGIGEHNNRREHVLTNILICKLLVSLLICLCILILSRIINESMVNLIFLYSIVLIAQVIQQNIFLEFQSSHKVFLYVVFSFINAFSIAIANIVFVTKMNLGIQGVIGGNILGIVFSCTLFIPFFIKSFKFALDIKLIKELYAYGLPLIFGNIAYLVTSTSDRFFIGELASVDALGLYAYGNKLASLLNVLIISPFFLGFNPMRWEIYKRKDSKQIFSELYTVLFTALVVCYFIFTLGGLFFGNLLAQNKDYIPGLLVTPLKTFSFFLFGLYYFRSMGLLFEKKTNLISLSTVIAGLINIILNIILIPSAGFLGAGYASVISYFAMYYIAGQLSQKYYRVKYPFNIEIAGLFSIILFCTIALIINNSAYYGLYFYGFTILFGFVVFVIFKNRQTFLNLIQKKKNINLSDF